jgi:hypothetical protein
MKKLLLYLVALLFSLSIAAQEINEQNQKLMDEYLKSKFYSEKEVMGPTALSKVFSGIFYKVQSGFMFVSGTSLGSNVFLNISEGKITEVEELTHDRELPLLLALVKKEFSLKDEPGAVLFEAALNELYPVEEKEKAGIKHMRKNNQWIFIRGKFFDNYTALIVTTGSNGVVTRIEVKLSYE